WRGRGRTAFRLHSSQERGRQEHLSRSSGYFRHFSWATKGAVRGRVQRKGAKERRRNFAWEKGPGTRGRDAPVITRKGHRASHVKMESFERRAQNGRVPKPLINANSR